MNPFPVSHYISPIYFCNRGLETKLLMENAENGINTTLFSIRRLGKTGLIHHLFYKINEDNASNCIYFDILSTQNQADFTRLLSNEIIKKFPPQKTIGKKFLEILKSFRPTLSYDALSGSPELSLDMATAKVQERTLIEIFQFLDAREVNMIIAIDEFQQILNYPEKNTEALLRTIMQQLKHIRFIFCGSNQNMMNEIFNSAKRPFFASCQNMHLDKIQHTDYKPFIHHHFQQHKKEISDESLEFILDWTCTHTYYTQYVCNKVFGTGSKKNTPGEVQKVCYQILQENEATYFQFRNLLTDAQWQLLKAIALETELQQPYASDFIFKNKLGTSSNVKRSLEALLQKEMIYQYSTTEEPFYAVYDKFLMRWFQNKR